MRDFKEHCEVPERCIPTRNLFGYDGCIEEERTRNKKTGKGSSHDRTGSDKVEANLGRPDTKGTQAMEEGD